MSTEEQYYVNEYAKERYLSYVLIRQRCKQHYKFNADIQNNITTGDDRMPKKRQTTLHLLDKYTNNPVLIKPPSEGVTFDQKGDRNKK